MIRNVCYIAGGYDNENKPIGKCFRIDTSSVSSMKRLNKSRNRLALTGLGEKYVIATGGRIQKSIVVSERYSIAKEKWEFINDLNEGRSAHSSCQFRNRFVFVFMGTNGTNDINSI